GPMLKALGQLTGADSIRELARAGESKRAEFKQAFSWDSRKQKKDRNLEEKSLKTIVAFLNSEGGDRLVGVSDNGEIRGVESEVKNLHKGNVDKLLLHVKNRIKDTIGEQFYPLLEQRMVKIDGVTVLWIHCARSEIPAYLNEVSFYVRTTPATDKLEGYKFVEYLRVRFGLEHRK
ncbi:MAG: ATP-binding protein, partial [Myxococcales bacterium]|nr:ATP-binding protein [Myxococcales bacterium]